jgi:hypothetical protein
VVVWVVLEVVVWEGLEVVVLDQAVVFPDLVLLVRLEVVLDKVQLVQ